MPLYEYECEAQGHRFEVIQKVSDPLVERCPTCGAPVHKLVSAPAFQFKGTGWYVTDYAKKGASDASTKTDSGGRPDSKDAKSDSKSEKKSDSSDSSSKAGKVESGSKAQSSSGASSSSTNGSSSKGS